MVVKDVDKRVIMEVDGYFYGLSREEFLILSYVNANDREYFELLINMCKLKYNIP